MAASPGAASPSAGRRTAELAGRADALDLVDAATVDTEARRAPDLTAETSAVHLFGQDAVHRNRFIALGVHTNVADPVDMVGAGGDLTADLRSVRAVQAAVLDPASVRS